MRKIMSFLFLSVFMLHLSSRMIIYIDFYVHQDYIAANLCENRFEEEQDCNGKCHLTKELQKDDQRKQQDEQRVQVEELVFIAYTFPSIDEISSSHFSEKDTYFIQSDANLVKDYHCKILHPPIV